MQFIVIFVVKVLKFKEVNDVREYEDEARNNAAAGLPAGSQENNDDDAGHHIAAERWGASNGVSLSAFFQDWTKTSVV